MQLSNLTWRIIAAILIAVIVVALGLITLEDTIRIWFVVGVIGALATYFGRSNPQKSELIFGLSAVAIVIISFAGLIPEIVEANDYRAVLAGIGVVIALAVPIVIYLILNRKNSRN